MGLLPRDLTPILQNTVLRGAGAIRWQRPAFVDLLPPCNHECPAGENIQAWLAHAQAGAYEQAWRQLMQDNPLPAAHGRACYHPCETACNRKDLDQAVSIHAVERFLGDLAAEQGWQVPVPPSNGKRVLVVGSGPAGLSCAYHLRLLGYDVEVDEAMPKPGGMMHYGIPAYRLPRADLMKEVARIEAMGVRIVCNHRIDDLTETMKTGEFAACFVAIGAHVGNHLDIPATDGRRIVDAIQMFEQVEAGRAPRLGRVVAVVGGGNTAMDAARTAKRLGAEEAILVYRRDRAHMRADPAEAHETFLEGVSARWLAVPKSFSAAGLTIEEIALQPDGSLIPTGRLQTLPAEALVLALGQHADVAFLQHLPAVAIAPDSTVGVDANLMTGQAGIFAGGDLIGGLRTITAATGHGKKAARSIDAWLRGVARDTVAKHPIVGFGMLNLPQFLDADRSEQRQLPVEERSGFAEVVAGLSEAEARHEAERCLSCGNCFECDNCFAACPEQAIIKLGKGLRYRFDYDLCTGCATCYEQCPCHAIEMSAEPADSRGKPSAYGAPVMPARFSVHR